MSGLLLSQSHHLTSSRQQKAGSALILINWWEYSYGCWLTNYELWWLEQSISKQKRAQSWGHLDSAIACNVQNLSLMYWMTELLPPRVEFFTTVQTGYLISYYRGLQNYNTDLLGGPSINAQIKINYLLNYSATQCVALLLKFIRVHACANAHSQQQWLLMFSYLICGLYELASDRKYSIVWLLKI